MKQDLGIYIHIPFCISKCYYCNFVSYVNQDNMIEEYINAVCMEILQNAEILSEYNIATVYFGGGTPSYIDSKYIKQIMDTLNLFKKGNDFLEVTLEVNPCSVTLDKLIQYRNCGINRISIGLQSTHDDILKTIGRKHTLNDFHNTLKYCKEAGFDNLSVDIIYPLPNLDLNRFSETLNYLMKVKEEYNIKHISIYNLEIHKGSKIEFLLNEGYVSLVDEETEYQMKELIESKLKENGFYPYEISNFCVKGFESKHNMNYWNQGIYLGFGVCSSSFFGSVRYKNTDSIKEYIKDIKSNISPIAEKESLDLLDLMKEFIILKLRLKNGFSTNEFKKFGKDIFDIFSEELQELKENQLIDIRKIEGNFEAKTKNYNIALTKRGCEVANVVWEKFV
ncbi:MAG: radical SAM family heme chaperone HemW [Clostridia bacterium]|nr:radical SAM family heme chaperone HemW [Clostridia bacterium]